MSLEYVYIIMSIIPYIVNLAARAQGAGNCWKQLAPIAAMENTRDWFINNLSSKILTRCLCGVLTGVGSRVRGSFVRCY